MSKMPIDLSKFKKIREDQNTTTLKHSDGHELTVAHGKLSSKLKSDLSKLPMLESSEPQAQNFDDGGMAGFDPSQNATTVASASPDQMGEAPNVLPSQPEQTAPQADQASIPPSVEMSATQDQSKKKYDPYGGIKAQIGGMKKIGQGQQAEAAALGQKGTEQATQEQQYQHQLADVNDRWEQANAPLVEARESLIQDIQNGHINPRKYLDDMSTGGKIAQGIGLILGGAGAGLTHGPNMALQYLQNQIDNDIRGQALELGKKENLLSANFRQTGDLREAMGITKMQIQDAFSSHLRQVADQSQDPIEKARALQAAGQTDVNTGQLQQQLAMKKFQVQAFSGQGGGQASGMALEMLPAEMRERAIQLPGGGMRLAITKDGAKEVREQFQTVKPIFDQLDKLSALGPSVLIPGTPAYQEAKSIRSILTPLINENAGLKRLSGEDIGNIRQEITDPTKFSGLVTGTRSAALKEFLQSKLLSTMGQQLEGGAPASKQSQGFTPKTFKPLGK